MQEGGIFFEGPLPPPLKLLIILLLQKFYEVSKFLKLFSDFLKPTH